MADVERLGRSGPMRNVRRFGPVVLMLSIVGASLGVEPLVASADGETYSATSTQLYVLTSSDGSTWQDMDLALLKVIFTPTVTTTAIISANSSLFTSVAGYSSDLAIYASGSDVTKNILAWKEGSGASAFSPTSIAAMATMAVTANVTYTLKLQWKSNITLAGGARLYAGAGSTDSRSTTSLIVQLATAGSAPSQVSSTTQYHLSSSDGSTWQDIDTSGLALQVTPTSSGNVILSAAADLFTDTVGTNQDLGIYVAGSSSPSNVVAWSESGGSAVYSARATTVQAVLPVTANTAYTIKLVWKGNIAFAGHNIYAGAGSSDPHSTTRLTAQVPSSGSSLSSASSVKQYTLSSSDGVAWQDIDTANLALAITPTSNCQAMITASADLFTGPNGPNQDLGISVSSASSPASLVAWEESGEGGVPFSPSATLVQAVVPMIANIAYTVKLGWKSNIGFSAPTAVYDGAGVANPYSPTSLIVQMSSCVSGAALPPSCASWQGIAGGSDHTVALKSDDTVWAWGRNGNGQLGNGTITDSLTPNQVPGLSNVTAVAAAGAKSFALKSDATVWAWGYNADGALGDGTTTDRSTPVQVFTGATALVAQNRSTEVLKSDGTVWAWGFNAYGQLGNGTTTASPTPVQVSGLSGVTAVGGTFYHSLALKGDGTVWTWGDNYSGEMGNNTTSASPVLTPQQVPGLSNVSVASGGYNYSLALKTDGTVWTWGDNSLSQLGQGNTTDLHVPTKVPGLSGLTGASTGSFSAMARQGGTLYTWGQNAAGQLGDGTTYPRTSPVQIPNFSAVQAVEGDQTGYATKSDGSLWAWGFNGYGAVGDGTTTSRSAPTQVPAFTPVGVPGTPSAVNAVSGNGTISLAWNAPFSNGGNPIAQYVVVPYITGTAQPTIYTGSSATNYTVTGLTNSTSYTFTVAAQNCAGASLPSGQSKAISPGVSTLNQPTVLHSNGAELTWTPYSAPAEWFAGYQVHRSTTAGFTPSASTLLTTITDTAATAYVDTSAAPGGTFSYTLVINGVKSNEVRVTLPAVGLASISLQQTPFDSSATYISSAGAGCTNFGADAQMLVGSDQTGAYRGLLRFNLSQLIGSSVVSATLKLYHTQAANNAQTLHAYPATTAWSEGTGTASAAMCTGDGASWVETTGGQSWSTPGGDYDAIVASSQVGVAANAPAQWDSFGVSSIVTSWATAQTPNLGFLVRADAEPGTAGNTIAFASNDFSGATFQPQLTISYTDSSKPTAPFVALSGPAPGSTVSGIVPLTAAAAALHAISQVQFFVDGGSSPVGTATAAPYTFNWNSTGVANGTHSITAVATDDGGNYTTSSAVSVVVYNVPGPTTTINSPIKGTFVSGTVSVQASASGPAPISSVDLIVDGNPIQTLTTSPYNFSWVTTGGGAYDGSHILTVAAHDSAGQSATSDGVNVTVQNTPGTKYQATISPPMGVPQTIIYDTSVTNTYTVPVTVTNNSPLTWMKNKIFLRYRWISLDTANNASSDGPNTALSGDVLPTGTGTATLAVPSPTLGAGDNEAEFQLVIDLYDTSNNSWFASQGNPPASSNVLVVRNLKASPGITSSAGLGLERYYDYVRQPVGAGIEHMVNVSNGNSLLQLNPFNDAGRGLATFAELTYNSLENHSDSPAGNNWSLAISSLSRLGGPLDVHPNNNDSNTSNRWIAFIDGDGTYHRFQGALDGSGNAYYVEPPGVHLYLRQYSTTDTSRWWALTRPDRVTFFYNLAGYPTSVTDRNGNTLNFTLAPGDAVGGPSLEVTKVTDAGGRDFNVNYYVKADNKKPQVRGKIKSLVDHDGHELDFYYYEDGNLLKLTQRGGANADGSFLADRSWIFTYTTSSGSGPAIPDPSLRVNPDPKTANESTRLFSVRDPRGAETTFAYITSGTDKWKLSSLTTRSVPTQTVSFGYDDTNSVTTVAAPLSRVTKYAYDSDGKVTLVTDPLLQQTSRQWSSNDFTVAKVIEPNTAAFTTYGWSINGSLVDKIDQASDHTQLTYQPGLTVDAADVAAHWCPSAGTLNGSPCVPRSSGHIDQLQYKQQPRGVKAGDSSFRWTFQYDANGNLQYVFDPLQNKTTNTYNSDGTLTSVRDANNNVTQYPAYDPSGLPTSITDGLNLTTQVGYDADGLVQWVQDPNHSSYSGGNPAQYRTYFYYDSFNRLGRQSTPKSTSFFAGILIWSDTFYDANDNVVKQMAPHFGAGDTETGDATTATYDSMDRPTLKTGPDTSADPLGERTQFAYDAAGRLQKVTLPLGMQNGTPNNTHTVNNVYDALDRVVEQTINHVDSGGAVHPANTFYCFDNVGNQISVTAPNAGLSSLACPAATGTAFTSRVGYDLAHRQTSSTDADQNATSTAYDEDSQIKSMTDALATTTSITRDQLDRQIQLDQPFVGGTTPRTESSVIRYDAVGNRTLFVSARGYDASPDKVTFTGYATSYHYDADNRLVRTDLPVDTGSYATPYYVHQAYDANGQTSWSALPDTNIDPTQVPSTKKTFVQYWDPGWVYTSQNSANPRLHFDYDAKGEQVTRTPETALGGLDLTHQIQWKYLADRKISARVDEQNQPISYTYDAEENVLGTHDLSGLTTSAQSFVDTQNGYDDLNRLNRTDVKRKTDANWGFTTLGYDLNGNMTDSQQSGLETAPGGTLVKVGKAIHYNYDQANRMADQTDNATTYKTVESYFSTGWEKSRAIDKPNGSGGWTALQTTNWDYYLNGKLNHVSTVNGAGTTVEAHTVSYLDAGGHYNDGMRTQDVFTVLGPDNTSPCRTTACTAAYTYDPRGRLVNEDTGTGTVNAYVLDAAGNISTQTTTGGSSVTQTYTYVGSQLQTLTQGTSTQKYWYDSDGNIKCVTAAAGNASNCTPSSGTTPSANLLSSNTYDYLDRLASARKYAAGTQTDTATYAYDALNRLATESETHPAQATKTTAFTYLGVSNEVTEEVQSNTSGPITTKDYSFDAGGHRLTMTNTPNGQAATTYTYAYNVHDSVSLLLNSTGTATSGYGYTAYGQADSKLTKGDSDTTNPLNAYRYAGKRYDSGSATIDMGARRFGPDISHFLQQDVFRGALADLGLSTDPLSQNRYALAGGNPLSFIEWDGHIIFSDGTATSQHVPTVVTPETGTDSTAINRVTPATGDSSSAPKAVNQCIQSLTCGLSDFEAMDVTDRMAWVDQFQNIKGTEYGFKNWFNAIHGFLSVARDKHLIVSGGWFSRVDAVTLESIQEGLYTSIHNSSSDNGAAMKWKAFFNYRRGKMPTDDASKERWGDAEQTSINSGVDTARGIQAPRGATTFTLLGDAYRFLVGHPVLARLMGEGDYIYDPRHEDPVLTLGHSAVDFSQTVEPNGGYRDSFVNPYLRIAS